MMNTMKAVKTDLEVVKTIVLAASPVRVWQALTDPAELVQWFPDKAAEVEVRTGAEGHWVWAQYGRFAVRFDVVEEPVRLVWTWAREADRRLNETNTTTVEFRLERNADGGTTLHVRETGFRRDVDRQDNDEGWDKELGELREYLSANR
jgi:uncharacterized protein YndB with AHSA1/START domain